MIYVFAAQGFEEIEALAVVDVLRRAELDVKLVGVEGKNITGSHGITVVCDLTIEEATPEGLEVVVLPGGMPGTLNLEKNELVQNYIDFAAANDKWICAICAAPSILGHKGLLDEKKATCYPGFDTQLGTAQYTAAQVEQDGKIITAKGAGAAIAFALKIVENLLGKERAQGLYGAMQC